MPAWSREQALARSLELWERRQTEFDQLPDVERRVARGDYEFVSSVDIELRELEQEAQRNGFVLDSNWDGQHLVYTIEPMSPEDHAAFWQKRKKSDAGFLSGWIAAQLLPPPAPSERALF